MATAITASSPYLGLSESDAIAAAKTRGDRVRIRSRDGKSLIGTSDYDPARHGLKIRDGLVVEDQPG